MPPDRILTLGSYFSIGVLVRLKNLPIIGIVLVSLLAGCAGPETSTQAQDGYGRLMAEMGGELELASWLGGQTPEQAQSFLQRYDLELVIHEQGASIQTAAGCPAFFEASERNKWHYISSGYYYIDASGRPRSAYRYLPPVQSAPRDDACQATVGNLVEGNYDGGHLVGSQLGGYGSRANLAPQDANFNRGNWLAIENQAARCAALPSKALTYLARVTYPDSSTTLPSQFTIELKIGAEQISRTFQNVPYGGSNGTTYRKEVTAWLAAHGCP